MRLASVLCVACLAGSAAAGPVLNFNEATGSTGFNNDQSVGWQFDVLSLITVTHLSWHDDGGDGLSRAHEVGIWSPSGALITSAVVPAGTAATLDGQWRVVPISPVNLTPGVGYIVGGYNGLNSTDRLAADVTHTFVDPAIRFIDATFSGANGIFERPTNFSSATTGFYGPSFNTIPAPSSLVLLGIGGLASARRRR